MAYDGDAAVAEFARMEPEVALLDIGMPRRSGYEVPGAIRGMPGGSTAMLIAITGWGQSKDRSTALAAGFDHHMTKPVDPDRLQELLARHAGQEVGALSL